MAKNAMIFGDSSSTFRGYLQEGYAVYYSEDEHPELDVHHVSQTWWAQLAKEADLRLVLNDSWSGSTIGYTGWEKADCSQTSSFIRRLRLLIERGFFAENEIHKVFVFGGTNDSWSNAPLGEPQYEAWEEEDLYNVLPAIACFLHLLKETLPHAELYCLINTGLKAEITACMKEACARYGITPVTFDSIDKYNGGHPTAQGMTDIKEAVIKALHN